MEDLTVMDLQTFSEEPVPAFSKAHWDKFAPKFSLDVDRDMYQLETFSVPCLSLPPSFHREVMRNLVQWLNIYQEWHVPVSAYWLNSTKEFDNQPLVYAVLTNLNSKFAIYENEIIVSICSCSAFLDGMRNGEHILPSTLLFTDHLFSVILEEYISTLNAIEANPYNLRLANHTLLDTWEAARVHGLLLLQSSVFCLSTIGSSTDWSEETLKLEIDKVLCRYLNAPPKA
ncbi:hypothetical protein BYT27DRAFT_7222328 [Phlegmacium glaucopus]|nr:hypothetical protein BYT27DRAFT_7222328 [Phlegmacium glaucopus]